MKPLRKARLHHIRIFHNQQNSPSPAAKTLSPVRNISCYDRNFCQCNRISCITDSFFPVRFIVSTRMDDCTVSRLSVTT